MRSHYDKICLHILSEPIRFEQIHCDDAIATFSCQSKSIPIYRVHFVFSTMFELLVAMKLWFHMKHFGFTERVCVLAFSRSRLISQCTDVNVPGMQEVEGEVPCFVRLHLRFNSAVAGLFLSYPNGTVRMIGMRTRHTYPSTRGRSSVLLRWQNGQHYCTSKRFESYEIQVPYTKWRRRPLYTRLWSCMSDGESFTASLGFSALASTSTPQSLLLQEYFIQDEIEPHYLKASVLLSSM